ncbi:MAG: hypothetical protein ACJAT1_000409 [Marivirga sp.]|jgi:uncharacterized protein (TIRG00374 family)
MKIDKENVLKTLNPNKVWIPILIGVGIVAFLFYQDESVTVENLSLIFTAKIVPVCLAFLVLAARDIGYVYRIRTITGEKLGWKSSIYVIILWEFASAVTPSVVGGTAVAVFILMKEGLKLGKALAYTMVTAIFDNLYFVVMAPIVFILAGEAIFPENTMVETQLARGLPTLFYVSYCLIAAYTLVMAFAVMVNPRWFKWILLKITSIKHLRKWRAGAYEQGEEIMIASEELRGKKASYWIKITLSTFFIWSARYAMLNCVIEAFTNQDFSQHITIFARQVVIWITMLISPTPGSSGTAEFIFTQFFKEDLGAATFVSNIFWRLMTYYPYLFLGAAILPRWIKRVFFKKK